jgi:hypothetical protein
MKHRKLEGIVEKRFEKINEAFEKALLHFHEDDIRIFRVKVKKLAAVLQLLDAEKAHVHPVKLPPGMIKISRLFGAIRTLLMQQNQVQNTIKEQQNRLPETYLKFISEQILESIKEVSKHINGTEPFKKEEEKLLGLLPIKLSQETMLKFVHTEGDALEKLFAPVFPDDKSLHEARKHLKNLLYVLPYVDMDISAVSPYKLLTSFEDINDFTKLLGNFHDLDTALSYLHLSVHKIEADADEKVTLRQLDRIWTAEKEVFRDQIYQEIQKISAS